MRAALYARVSTEEQAKEGFSIPAQIAKLRAWATIKDIVEYDIFVDEGYSGKNLRRPDVQKMLEGCRQGKYDILLIWRLDRLSRSLRDTVVLVEDDLIANGVSLVSTTESIDTSSPSGRLMLNILAAFAQNEREATVERVVATLCDMAKNCVHLGGRPPYGYAVGPDKHYIIKEPEADAVRLMFRLYANGSGYKAIMAELERRGIFSRNGNPFSQTTIYEILHNEKYSGVYLYNRAAPASRDGRRNNHASKSPDEIIRIPGGMPAIIDRDLWQRAQEHSRTHFYSGSRCRAKREYLCSGLVYCAVCGQRMNVINAGHNRNGTYQMAYGCAKKHVKYIRWEKLDAMVLDYVRSLASSEAVLRKAAEIASAYTSKQNEDARAAVPQWRAQIADIDRRLQSIAAFIANTGAAAPITLARQMRELEDERAVLTTQIAEAARPRTIISAEDLLDRVRAAAALQDPTASASSGSDSLQFRNADSASPASSFPSESFQKRKQAVARLIRRITVHDDRVNICLNVGLLPPLPASHADSMNIGGGDDSETLMLSIFLCTINRAPKNKDRI